MKHLIHKKMDGQPENIMSLATADLEAQLQYIF